MPEPEGTMMRLLHTRLEIKIMAAMVSVLCTVIGIFTIVDIRTMRNDMTLISEQSLQSLARTVKGNIAAAMKQGQHKNVQGIIDGAKVSFGIDHIIMYDGQGKSVYQGGKVRHGGEEANQLPHSITQAVLEGDRSEMHGQGALPYLTYYSPIANQPECFQCHDQQNKLNGILRIDFSLQWMETLIDARRNSILVWTVIMLATLMVALLAMLRFLVHRPVKELRDAMVRAEAGDEVPELTGTAGKDELADLKWSFVSMLQRINALHRTNLEKEKAIVHHQETTLFRAELQAMFDAMPDGVLLIDREMQIVQGNPRAYELLPELKTFAGRIPAERVGSASCPHYGVRTAFLKSEACEHQCTVTLPGGQVRYLHSICAPILENGRVAFMVEVIRDITERIKTERELGTRTAELVAANRTLSRIAITDGLTQVYNRRRFDEILAKEIKRFTRRKYAALSLMMIDIDHFKKLNDTYGHLAGDMVLREIATVLKEAVRETDTVARYGGEEFVIIMPDTTLDGAAYKAEVLRKRIEVRAFPGHETLLNITVSIGVAKYTTGTPDELLADVDHALYKAKDAGRNAVVVSRRENMVTP